MKYVTTYNLMYKFIDESYFINRIDELEKNILVISNKKLINSIRNFKNVKNKMFSL